MSYDISLLDPLTKETIEFDEIHLKEMREKHYAIYCFFAQLRPDGIWDGD